MQPLSGHWVRYTVAEPGRGGKVERFSALRQWARRIKRDTYALYLACRDSRVPWYAKVVAACVVAYAFSPIDLVPDFVPVLGYLDDVIIVPLGILLALRLVPPAVMVECRERAEAAIAGGSHKPRSWVAGAVIIAVWLAAAAWAIAVGWRFVRGI